MRDRRRLLQLAVAAIAIAVLVEHSRRRRRATLIARSDVDRTLLVDAPSGPVAAPAAAPSSVRPPGVGRRVLQKLLVPTIVLALLAAVQVGVTSAFLSDGATAQQVVVTGGSVVDPSGLALSDTGSAIQVAWTAPGTGLTPPAYDVFRRPSTGSYGGTATGTSAASPWIDTTATECTTWFYKARSRHTNLVSGFTPEQSIRVDRTDPVVSEAHVVWGAVTPKVADFVRVNPGGAVEVYANATDNCAAMSALGLQFQMGAPISQNLTATYNATGWTPIVGGPTYNFRALYTLPNSLIANTQVVNWNVVATDPDGNAATTAGTPFTGDGAGPVFNRAQMVSAYTNFYDVAYGVGEIPSDGTARASGSYVYADFSDASGVKTITADLTVPSFVVKTGTPALPLAEGTYSTFGNGSSWTWRSAATVVNTAMADGTRRFHVTATDVVGNAATTASNRNVEIDDTVPAVGTGSCLAVAGAGSNNLLAAGDGMEYNFGDTIWTGSLRANWDGSTLSGPAVLRNGGTDYFDLNGDFGISLFAGSTNLTSFNLNNNWIAANTSYAGSTFGLVNRTTLGFTLGGTPSVTAIIGNVRAEIGATIRDAAGNKAAAPFRLQCSGNAW
ncbi:MAG: Signal peptidase [Thermoleophilia bacterium]|nr:Signal peptidase [Thermoleophilia bacterium]